MTSISITTNGMDIAADLDVVDRRTFRAVRSVVEQSAIDMRDTWRANAQSTSGTHGRLYPPKVNYRMVPTLSAIVADIEPDDLEVGAAYEFGSRKQPPHLDGQRALDTVGPRIPRRINAVLVF